MEVGRFAELLLVYFMVLLDQYDVFAYLQQSPEWTSLTWPYGKYLNSESKRMKHSQFVTKTRRRRTVINQSIAISQMLEYIDEVTKKYERTSKCVQHTVNKFDIEKVNSWYNDFSSQTNRTLTLANSLNSLFLYSTSRERDKQRTFDDAYYVSLSRAVIESDSSVTGCGIAFAKNQYNQSEYFSPYVYRDVQGSIHVVDLASTTKYANSDWFTFHNRKPWKHTTILKHTPIFHNKFKTGQPITQPWNITLKVSHKVGYWTLPYFSCNGRPSWTITYSLPFLDWDGTSAGVVFKGVVFIDIDLSQFDLNQCRSGPHMLANTHRCRFETTECKHIPGHGFSRGNYECHCKSNYYFSPNSTSKYFNGSQIERAFLDYNFNRSLDYANYNCLICKPGCTDCDDGEPCLVEMNILIRGIPLGIQSFCMTITVVVAIVVWRLRKTKVMLSSMWIMMEVVLIGALLLYATVVIQYFETTLISCLLIPWCREVGFAVMYGALVLKLYRLLSEFQSRKAHRVHVRDKDLLKYLCCIIVVVLGFMAAWTAVNMDHLPKSSLLKTDRTSDHNLIYSICISYWWDYVMEFVELLFLFFAIYLCYCTRSAPSDYREGKYVSIAIYNETTVSTILYITKHILWLQLHPDYLFLMYFIRCQLSVTVTLFLVLGPKLWFAHRPPDDDHCRNRAFSTTEVQDNVGSEALKLNVAISSNGDVDVGEINLSEMDPEDIRLELKRLYTQLQVYRTKTMRRDNPHISKRRGGRKQTHRRFSLQAFHHKHKHHQPEQETEHEMSKTPEDSTNSAELTLPVGESTSCRHDDHDSVTPSYSSKEKSDRSGPTVTFKAGHKCIV